MFSEFFNSSILQFLNSPSSGPSRRVLCINKFEIARQTPFPFVDDAKLRTKKGIPKQCNGMPIICQ